MKKTLLALGLLLGLLGLTQTASAQEFKYGVGLRFAYLTPGLDFNYFKSTKIENEGILSGGWHGEDLLITGLYKTHYPLQIEAADLTWYWGVGAHLGNQSSNGPLVGANGTIGLQWVSKEIPIGITLDLSPILDAITYGNDSNFKLDLGMGLHYYFK